jgi:hypothetical protein
MIEPVNIAAIATATLTSLAHHAPWLADKVGGSAISQTVRETWDLVKHKLSSTAEGKEALAQVETGTAPTIESLKAPLLAALESDQNFAPQLSRLVVIGSENQIAAGDNNKQAKVTGSENVNISIG